MKSSYERQWWSGQQQRDIGNWINIEMEEKLIAFNNWLDLG